MYVYSLFDNEVPPCTSAFVIPNNIAGSVPKIGSDPTCVCSSFALIHYGKIISLNANSRKLAWDYKIFSGGLARGGSDVFV